MNCEKSKDLLIIRFDKELLDNENVSINELLSEEIAKEQNITFRLEEKYMLIIESEESLHMNIMYNLIEKFSEERGIKFQFILVKEAVLAFEDDENTEEYLTKFIKMPDDDSDVIGVEIKFIYKSSTTPLFVHMEDNNEDKVIVRIMDLSEVKDDFNKCYDYMEESLMELIKM